MSSTINVLLKTNVNFDVNIISMTVLRIWHWAVFFSPVANHHASHTLLHSCTKKVFFFLKLQHSSLFASSHSIPFSNGMELSAPTTVRAVCDCVYMYVCVCTHVYSVWKCVLLGLRELSVLCVCHMWQINNLNDLAQIAAIFSSVNSVFMRLSFISLIIAVGWYSM